MSTARVYRRNHLRTRGREDDPLVTVSLHLRKRQLTALDQRADAARTSRAALVREAINRLLTHLKRLSSGRMGG
jgi:Ribbon-helix-helix protein, copG family